MNCNIHFTSNTTNVKCLNVIVLYRYIQRVFHEIWRKILHDPV